MPRKSSAFRLAPPTSAPSTLATRHQFRGVRRLHRAAVENADRLAPPPPYRAASRLADEAVHLGDVGRGRRQAGADRPDRLIGDHQVGAGRAIRQRAVELAAEHVERLAGVALGLASRRRRRSPSARRARRPAPWRAPARRFPCDRSAARNGRRSPRLAPASASISAEMSPVKAPDGSAWQSWPPIATVRAVRRRREGRRPAWPAGRSSGRPWPADRPRPAMILPSSAAEALQPVHLPIARDQRAALRCGHAVTPFASSR